MRQQFISFAAVVLAYGLPTAADDRHWNVTSGHWNVPTNWLEGLVPLDVDTVYIANNGTCSVDAAINAACLGLDLGGYQTSGRVELSDGGRLTVYGNESIGGVALSSGYFVQTGGTHDIAGNLAMADFAASAWYTLQGGQLLVGGSETVGGDEDAGSASFSQSGGEHVIADSLTVGIGGRSSSVFRFSLSGDAHLSVGGDETVGFQYGGGTSLFEQSGGLHTVAGDLRLGYGPLGASGTFVLDGDGQLSVDGDEYLASWDGQSGSFVQHTGVHSVGGTMYLGHTSGGVGSYEIAGGSLETKGLHVGYEGSGRLTMSDSDASVTVSGLLSFGGDSTLTAVPGSAVDMMGSSFETRTTSPAALTDLANLNLIFEGGDADVDSFEVAGIDLGPIDQGFDLNFALGMLTLGGEGTGQIRLFDDFDNHPGLLGSEALYVDTLVLNAGSYLDLNGFNLYCRNLVGSLSIIDLSHGGSLALVPEPAALCLLAFGGLATALRRRT